VIYNILERIRHISLMLWPFMPQTSEKIWEQLGLNVSEDLARDFKKATQWGGLKPGTKIKKGDVLFPRI
jgi:methionyl-tRNA synthetase